MAAIALTAGILLLWFVQGVGVVQWLAPEVRRDSLVGWITAIWAGLVGNAVIVPTLYFAIPGCTVGQLAWPIALTLAAGSAALYAATPRPRVRLDAHGWAVVVVAAAATLLVLRPLLGHAQLGFYFSNNGEFANYAVLADAVQYHGAGSDLPGPFALTSREAMVGTLGGMIATLSGRAALWVIQPLAAALAALAFASLGVLLRHAARRYARGEACRVPGAPSGRPAGASSSNPGRSSADVASASPGDVEPRDAGTASPSLSPPAIAVLALVHGCAVLTAAAQCFWTLSFVSQYLSVAMFFGGLVLLTAARELAGRRRIAVLGALFAALVYAYPEMTVPNLGMLAVYEVAAAGRGARSRGRAALAVLAALAIALVVTNRYGVAAIAQAGTNTATGWNIFGPHRPVLDFVAALTGMTARFVEPGERSAVWPLLAAALLAASLVHAAIAARREPAAGLRGLYALVAAFAIGVAALFAVIAYQGLASNYLVLKFILGYGWLAYIGLGAAAAWVLAQRPRATPAVAATLVALAVGLASPALAFSRQLGRAAHEALFLAGDGARVRELLGGARPYIAADIYPIVGRFLAFDRDVMAIDGRWPDGTGQRLARDQPIVVVGDRKLSDDPQVAQPYRVRWRGHHVAVMEPAR